MKYCTDDYAAEYAANLMHDKFEQFHLGEKMEFPSIEWKPMGKNVAGLANVTKNHIMLNSNYLHSKSWKDFLNETPLHELAHVVTYYFLKKSGHCKEWKHVCRKFGLDGNRCHNFATPENLKEKISKARKYYIVHCSCMTHEISSIRYKRMLAGETYICAKCHQKLSI